MKQAPDSKQQISTSFSNLYPVTKTVRFELKPSVITKTKLEKDKIFQIKDKIDWVDNLLFYSTASNPSEIRTNGESELRELLEKCESQINNIEIVEGSRNRITYQVTGVDSFVVPDRKADISTLKVSVFAPGNSTNSVVFTPADSILSVSSTSNVFFLKQREDQFYQIYFGDGQFGASIVSGSTVAIEYSISSGSVTNLSKVFVYSAGADSSANYYCTTS